MRTFLLFILAWSATATTSIAATVSRHSAMELCIVDSSPALLAKVGGKAMICSQMRSGVASVGSANLRYRVKILSPSHAAAFATLPDGRTIGPVETRVSDGRLAPDAFLELAKGIAAAVKPFIS